MYEDNEERDGDLRMESLEAILIVAILARDSSVSTGMAINLSDDPAKSMHVRELRCSPRLCNLPVQP